MRNKTLPTEVDRVRLADQILRRVSQTNEYTLPQVLQEAASYHEYRIPKNSGGYRTISEPPPVLKEAQSALLSWLQRLEKRTIAPNDLQEAEEAFAYFHHLDYRLHGSRLKRSTATAVRALTGGDFLFLIKLDLKEAFPSVRQEYLANLLERIFLDECALHYRRIQRKLFLKAIPEIKAQAKKKGIVWLDTGQRERLDKAFDLAYRRVKGELIEQLGTAFENCYSWRLSPEQEEKRQQRERQIRQILREQQIENGDQALSRWEKEIVAFVSEKFPHLDLKAKDACYLVSGEPEKIARLIIKEKRENAVRRRNKKKSSALSFKKREKRPLTLRKLIISLRASRLRVTQRSFLQHSLFPVGEQRELHALIWEAARANLPLAESIIPIVMKQLAEKLAQLFTYRGVLPQGAPTSGLLLNLAVTDSGLLRNLDYALHASVFSEGLAFPNYYFEKEALRYSRNHKLALAVYVDDIAIALMKKPDPKLLARLEEAIAKTGIFRANTKKTRVYDLRPQSAPILGLKLVRRPLTAAEADKLEKRRQSDRPRGYSRAQAQGRAFRLLSATLSKEKQKQYRAFFHRLAVSGGTDEEWKQADGCFGQIVSTYGQLDRLPSSLKKAVQEFRNSRKN